MGLVHLDAGVVIGFLDADDAHHEASRFVLASAVEDAHTIAIAASVLAECLVGPARRGEQAMATVRAVIERVPMTVIDLGPEIATRAAVLRSQHRRLRLPDALVIATAAESDAERLVTTDRRWPAASDMNLNVEIETL